MEDTGKTVVWSMLLAIVVAVVAVFAYNQIVAKPQMAEMQKQITQLTQNTNHNSTVLDKHTEAIDRLSGTVSQNADATNTLAGTVSNNAAVANQNAATANYNASLQPNY